MPAVSDRAGSGGGGSGSRSRSPAAAMGSPRRALAGLSGRGTGSVEGAEEAESAAWASRPDRRSYLLGIRPQNR